MRRAAHAGLALIAALATGCVHGSVVERAYDGHVVDGRFVPPEAYAAYLRGVLADADGRPAEALDAFAYAARIEPASPEVWTRIGEIRCRVAAGDPEAQRALARALALDERYAPAWSARAACALARGEGAEAAEAASRAVDLDPAADGAHVLLARQGRGAPAAADVRARLVALTSTSYDPSVAWDALAAWARGAGDVALWAEALRGRLRVAPERRVATARAAEELVGGGETGEARAVAAAAVDASTQPLPPGTPLAARLAIDAAIARHDGDAARARSTRTRVGLAEVAARALLAGDRVLARDLAAEVARADASERGARLVLAVTDGGDLAAAATDARPGDVPISAAALVAFGLGLSRAVRDEAHARLAPLASNADALVPGDDVVGRPAVALVSRGALPAAVLTADGVVELAALQVGAPVAVPVPAGVDERHELLALALSHPDAPRTFELRRKLAPEAAVDPVVAAAVAIAMLAAGAPVDPGASDQLLARNPADPLLAATALRLAERVGDRTAAVRARQALAAAGGGAPGPKID